MECLFLRTSQNIDHKRNLLLFFNRYVYKKEKGYVDRVFIAVSTSVINKTYKSCADGEDDSINARK